MGGNGDVESGPPAYSEGVSDGEKLPSYAALYGKIQAAQMQSSGKGEFAKSFCEIITDTVGFLILLCVSLAIPILSIVVGALNLNNCPAERFIPIWLVVAGAFGAFQQIVGIVERIKKRQQKHDAIDGENTSPFGKAFAGFNSLLGCFNIAWFIAGCVWVYSNYAPETENAAAPGYCEFTTYYLAFWLLTLVFIFMGLLIFCCCCITCCLTAGAIGGAATFADEKLKNVATAEDD